ncbi:MAG: hypothetical protein AAGK14_11775 [Verrucomicrobiota bacterium]
MSSHPLPAKLCSFKYGRALPALAALFLAGCGGGGSAGDDSVNKIIELSEQTTTLNQQVDQLEKQKRQLTAQLPLLQKKLEASQEKLDNLQGELQALGSGPGASFAQFNESVEGAPPEMVIIMSRRFVRDYPLSPNLEQVRAKLADAQQQLDAQAVQQQQEEAQREAELAAQRRARVEKFKNGQMNTTELKALLRGKSQPEIIEFMGQPRSKARRDVWNYPNYEGISSTGKKGRVRVFFSGGRVNSVGLY